MNNLKEGTGYINKKLQPCLVVEKGLYSNYSKNIYTNQKYRFADDGTYMREDILSDGKLYTVQENYRHNGIAYLTNLFVLCYIDCSITGKSKMFLYSASEKQKTNRYIESIHIKLCNFKNSIKFNIYVQD